MNFTEFEFWPRLFLALLCICLIRLPFRKHQDLLSVIDRSALAALSMWLLVCVGGVTATIFSVVFLSAWALIAVMFRLPLKRRRIILWIGIPLLFLPLAYYKYRLFVGADLLGLDPGSLGNIAIPAGISFYSFQMVALLVDASRLEKWKPRFLDYLNFASFFPQVVAGPIERKGSLFPQMENFSFRWSWANLNEGAPWLALGFFYKFCVADNLDAFIDRDAMESAWPIVFCTFLFGLKIYFDFCSYSLIALGIAKSLGIELTLNFRSPYWSGSIREFWRRWHISLSYWFRDYVYIPMGGSKTKFWAFNLAVVFTISGIWHGAGWGFILWGAFHGLFSIVSHYCKGFFRLPWLLGWAITTVCVFATWLPFYETRSDILKDKVRILCDLSAWAPSSLFSLLREYNAGDLVTLLAAIGLAGLALGSEGICRFFKRDDYSHAQHPLTIAFCVVCIIFLGATESNEFIYFSF